MQSKTYSVDIGGKTLSAEFNDWADQANGSVLVRYGNSAVLATAVMGSKESNLDYFPLSVEYEEKFYAAGAILGSRFMRREGRPSDEAVPSASTIASSVIRRVTTADAGTTSLGCISAARRVRACATVSD